MNAARARICDLRLSLLKSLSFFTVAIALAACTIPTQVAQGTSREEVIARIGQPTSVVSLPGGGQRLQYSLQPAGQLAWMVDLDTAGRVTRVRQVLTEDEFQRIVPGEWTRSDVEREFGPPGSSDARLMTYRWRDAHGADSLYWLYLDAQGVVRAARYGTELPGNFTDL
jgi:hypothetical protein